MPELQGAGYFFLQNMQDADTVHKITDFGDSTADDPVFISPLSNII